jgi:uncharacterized protein (TIGR03435 family)
MRRLFVSLTVCAISGLLAAQTRAQSGQESPSPQFDVAAVKPNPSVRSCLYLGNYPNRLTARGCPVNRLIQIAFQLRKDQIVGVPAWDQNASFDINATFAPEAGPTREARYRMLQHLLAERFMLATHREERQATTYEILLAKKDWTPGKGMQPSDIDCQQWISEKRNQGDEGVPSPLTPDHKRPACMFRVGDDYIVGGTQTVADLAKTLAMILGHPVVDRTPLLRTFDFDVKFSRIRDALPSGAAADPSDAPSIFTALEDQLGLKLQAVTSPVEVLVIDHIERPTEN